MLHVLANEVLEFGEVVRKQVEEEVIAPENCVYVQHRKPRWRAANSVTLIELNDLLDLSGHQLHQVLDLHWRALNLLPVDVVCANARNDEEQLVNC